MRRKEKEQNPNSATGFPNSVVQSFVAILSLKITFCSSTCSTVLFNSPNSCLHLSTMLCPWWQSTMLISAFWLHCSNFYFSTCLLNTPLPLTPLPIDCPSPGFRKEHKTCRLRLLWHQITIAYKTLWHQLLWAAWSLNIWLRDYIYKYADLIIWAPPSYVTETKEQHNRPPSKTA